ncbi:MAG: FG-GAP repeat protein [Alphaproteobacteria bacterium]|nr:FG-GAP repeat protein [Alphaproteobacteria bacterium]
MRRVALSMLPVSSLLLGLVLTACGDKDPGTGKDLGEDADGDGWPAETDCNDADASIFPGADELCNDIDDDCDDLVDEEPVDGTDWYADIDGDGYGVADWVRPACTQPAGWVDNADDCDDLSPETWPGADEICDDADNDCDGAIDESPTDAPTWYVDEDGDGYGDPTVPIQACTAPGVYVQNADDCDDGDASLNPATVWYGDVDGDGYGGTNFTAVGCEPPDLHVADSSDCDDFDATINPLAEEICDGIDNDCDGDADGATATDALTFYEDSDGDGFGVEGATAMACTAPDGFAADLGDCDDTDADISPLAAEDCSNGIDDDCDDIVDDFCAMDLGDADVVWEGENAADYSGYHLHAGGDFDGDGNADLVVGAYGWDLEEGLSAGRTYVSTTPTTGGELAAVELTIDGGAENDYFGYALAVIDDVSGDAYGDVIVGAWGRDIDGASGTGAAYLFHGPATGALTVDDADAAIYGDSSLDYLGQYEVTGGGDVTGDGAGDVIVGMTGDDVPYSSGGALLVFAGPVSGELSPDGAAARIQATGTAHYVGYHVVTGDVTGDGVLDVAYGASGERAAHVIEGPLAGTWDANDALYSVTATEADGLGANLLLADIDGDGDLDMAVGAKYDGTYGGNTGAWYVMDGPLTGDVDTTSAVAKIAETAENRYFGAQNHQADAGFVDGDDAADLLLGSANAGIEADSRGHTYLFFGPVSGTLDADAADWTFRGEDVSHAAGYGADLADLDGDGAEDVIIGARGAVSGAGRTYIVFGSGL